MALPEVYSQASGVITREDCADLIIKALGSVGTCTRRELTAIDPSQDAAGGSFVPFKI